MAHATAEARSAYAVYHHVYAVGRWQPILAEHLDALAESGLAWTAGGVQLGIIGPPRARELVKAFAAGWAHVHVAAEADAGWEQVTLTQLHADAQAGHWDAALYLHTKGVTTPQNRLAAAWRRSMLRGTVTWWRHCVEAIQDGADIVGCHWLRPGEHPRPVEVPYFGGNFWWASGEFIRSCQPPGMQSRHDAEMWLGRNSPGQIVDLAPGWPGPSTLLRYDDQPVRTVIQGKV